MFLTGDAQPSAEKASYELTEIILDVLKKFSCKQIIALGGIGLGEVPPDPQVFVTGSDKKATKPFVKLGADPEIFGIVGPIIGVSGLLLGLGKKKNIPAVALLGETFGHPMYIGLKEARKIIELLDKQFSLQVDYKEIDEEIELVQEDMLDEHDIESKDPQKSKRVAKLMKYKDLNYIG